MTPAIRQRWMESALEVSRRAHALFDLIEAENLRPGAPCEPRTAQAIVDLQRATQALANDARGCAALWMAAIIRARTETRPS